MTALQPCADEVRNLRAEVKQLKRENNLLRGMIYRHSQEIRKFLGEIKDDRPPTTRSTAEG